MDTSFWSAPFSLKDEVLHEAFRVEGNWAHLNLFLLASDRVLGHFVGIGYVLHFLNCIFRRAYRPSQVVMTAWFISDKTWRMVLCQISSKIVY